MRWGGRGEENHEKQKAAAMDNDFFAVKAYVQFNCRQLHFLMEIN